MNGLTAGVSGGGREPGSETGNRHRSGTSPKNAATPRRPLHALLDGTVITEPTLRQAKGSGADSPPAQPTQLSTQHRHDEQQAGKLLEDWEAGEETTRLTDGCARLATS